MAKPTEAQIKEQQVLNTLAKEIFFSRCSLMNISFSGPPAQISEMKIKAAQFFQGEAAVAFSAAKKFVAEMKNQMSNGSQP